MAFQALTDAELTELLANDAGPLVEAAFMAMLWRVPVARARELLAMAGEIVDRRGREP
jgi:hypothetical protein